MMMTINWTRWPDLGLSHEMDQYHKCCYQTGIPDWVIKTFND